eukprot:GFUD01027613.1.p1 GENE.GFUD01027613.1~~GFUD01027613.1.p1  ORF type:complete len:198 (+),score=81.47 GFUD01027613.1:123-716(+)
MAATVAKKALRAQMKVVLSSLSQDIKTAQSVSVTAKLLQLPCYQTARSVALFLSMEDEVDTDLILDDILHTGKKCYIPKYYMNSSKMEMVRLQNRQDYTALPVTKWKIKQPAYDDIREEALDSVDGLDLILVPGLAFTQSGARCGRGRGYYDTYLARSKEMQKKPPITVALAFKEQVVEDVPTDQHDFIIDHVLAAD